MTRRMTITSLAAAGLFVAIVALVWLRGPPSAGAGMGGGEDPDGPSAFARRVDLSALSRVAVHEDGRLKSFPSFASGVMHFVCGSRSIEGNPDAFSYLDLMFRPQEYRDRAAVHVRNKPLRGEIAAVLLRSLQGGPGPEAGPDAGTAEALERFVRRGLIPARMLESPEVEALLQERERDLIRTSKAVNQIRAALHYSDPHVLREGLRIVPPPGGDASAAWLTVGQYAALPPEGIDAGVRGDMVIAWSSLERGWMGRDAPAVSAAAARLAGLLPAVNPALYPDARRLSWESWYFRSSNLTWVWMVYLLAVVLLVMWVAYRWPAARVAGLAMFGAAFGLHTFALLLRWYVSERWPNSNMFEAVTTSVWFGGCLAVLMEALLRRSPMKGLFALGSAVSSMIALMCAHFMPLQLNANIANKMPVLHDVWLYIHTNVVIFSYVLIAMAAVSALLYLLWRIGGGGADHVRGGGAASLMLAGAGGGSVERSSAGAVFDGATMVLMELSFIMLWAGLVMGAIWADHSWGRPWGWDPKEVFALNTFIMLALLVHTRLKVRDKGLWTAILALAGFAVMLFNWIFINFWIVGLHSYA